MPRARSAMQGKKNIQLHVLLAVWPVLFLLFQLIYKAPVYSLCVLHCRCWTTRCFLSQAQADSSKLPVDHAAAIFSFLLVLCTGKDLPAVTVCPCMTSRH